MKKEKLFRAAAALVVVLLAGVAGPAARAAQSRNTRRAPRPAAAAKKTTPANTTAKPAANVSDAAAPAPDEKAPAKKNARAAEPVPTPATSAPAPDANAARYVYEFSQPGSFLQRVRIEHDATGRGRITFERNVDTEELTDPFEFSADAFRRVKGHWDALRFLDTEGSYQAEKQFPHLGTTRLRMAEGKRERATEFNWTNDAAAGALAKEYRNAAEQALFVFELGVALENQPLEIPKLLGRFERLTEIGGLSDPQQLIPLLVELESDERVPLVARNHAGRLLKKLRK